MKDEDRNSAVYIIFLIVTTLRLFERTFFARSDWCFSVQFLFGSCKLPPGCNTNSQFHAVSASKDDAYFKRFNCRKNDTMTFNLVPFGLALLFIALIAFHTWCCVTFSTVVYEATKINQRCRRCGGWRCRQCAEQPFYGGANNEQTQFL
ncbi:hypothetical protein Ddc_12029 [Ditylenchus destructor]|nr:hypothetical protein Ddc_12029 [Ditylenchus destructor]